MMQECSGTWKQFFWIETITSLGEQIWNPPKFYQFYHKFYQVFANCTFEKCKLDNLRHYFCALIGFLKKKSWTISENVNVPASSLIIVRELSLNQIFSHEAKIPKLV